jgi:hypothetical protein
MSQNFAMMTPEMQEQQLKQTGFQALAGQAEKINRSINYALAGLERGRLEATPELTKLLKSEMLIYETLMPISDKMTDFSRDLQKAINNAGGGKQNQAKPAKKKQASAAPKKKKDAQPTPKAKAKASEEKKVESKETKSPQDDEGLGESFVID